MFWWPNLRSQGSHDDDDAQLIVNRREGQFYGGSWERISYMHGGRGGLLEMKKQSLDDYHVNGVMISHSYYVSNSMFFASVIINRNVFSGSLAYNLCPMNQGMRFVKQSRHSMPSIYVGGFKNVDELSYGLNEVEAYFKVQTNVIGMDIMDVSVQHCYEYQGARLDVKLKIEKHPRKGIAARVTECTNSSNYTGQAAAGHQLQPNTNSELPVVATTPQAQPGSYNNSGQHIDSRGITRGNANSSVFSNCNVNIH